MWTNRMCLPAQSSDLTNPLPKDVSASRSLMTAMNLVCLCVYYPLFKDLYLSINVELVNCLTTSELICLAEFNIRLDNLHQMYKSTVTTLSKIVLQSTLFIFCSVTYTLYLCLCRCWRWGLLPASLPALPGYRSDQCGWHGPLLCSGRCTLVSLSGLLQKCRLLLWPDTARGSSHPTVVYSRVIAATSWSTLWSCWPYFQQLPATSWDNVF